MKFRNKKTGEVIEGTEQEMEEVFSELEKTGEIVDWEEYNETATAPVETKYGKTSYEERKKYFGGGVAGGLAEAFPSLAEQYMQGNTGYNLGTLGAGLNDALSYITRLYAGMYNELIQGNEGFNLGRRSEDEGTHPFAETFRDPMFFGGLSLGGPINKVVKGVGTFGNKLLGIPGRISGKIIAGGGVGAGMVQLGADLKKKNPDVFDYALGAGLGAGLEAAGGVVNLIETYGPELVRSIATALKLGNTKRLLSDGEFNEFVADPKNADALEKTLKIVSTGRSATPFIKDRGELLRPEVERAKSQASGVIEDEPMLNRSFDEGIDKDASISEKRDQRAMNALKDKDVEAYQLKTVYKPGQRDMRDEAFPRDYADSRLFIHDKKAKEFKNTDYQSNSEFNIEKFMDKYDNLWESIKNSKRRSGTLSDDELKLFKELRRKKYFGIISKNEQNVLNELNKKLNYSTMTDAESQILSKLKEELDKDVGVINGYTPEIVIEKNKFLGDRMPFNSKFIKKELQPFVDKNGMSDEFSAEVQNLIEQARSKGRNVKNVIDETLRSENGSKEGATIERAFAYSSERPISVKKGYRNPIDRFADTLSDYADISVGEVRKNADGKEYFVNKDRMKKYSYEYLAKVQDILKSRGSLNANDITSLYGEATNVNDKVVQDAILQLLRDLNVSEGQVENFKKVASTYAMMNKAIARLNRSAKKENSVLKGTVLDLISPQEGVNSPRIMAYKANKALKGLNLDMPTEKARSASRTAGYNLGVPLRNSNDNR